jgi:hypothetical protein
MPLKVDFEVDFEVEMERRKFAPPFAPLLGCSKVPLDAFSSKKETSEIV